MGVQPGLGVNLRVGNLLLRPIAVHRPAFPQFQVTGGGWPHVGDKNTEFTHLDNSALSGFD